jgi:hypothetical protein
VNVIACATENARAIEVEFGSAVMIDRAKPPTKERARKRTTGIKRHRSTHIDSGC